MKYWGDLLIYNYSLITYCIDTALQLYNYTLTAGYCASSLNILHSRNGSKACCWLHPPVYNVVNW